MALKELKLDIGYNSETLDVAKEFFIPVLKDTRLYRRVSAYYSSESLKVIAEGLSEMLTNDGVMKLLISYVVSEEDFNAIINAKKRPEEILAAMNIDDETTLREMMKNKNVAALGYLIASNRLAIKFVICRGRGIFHLKFGIFTDINGDEVSFSGSINETYEGLTNNIEEFKVFRSWVAEENKYLKNDSALFDSYWNGTINKKDYLIADMPEKFKGAITKISQETATGVRHAVKQLPKLWPHQQTAIDKWTDNNFTGILEMATGTGKTIVAMSCIRRMADTHPDNFLVVIGCPTNVLVAQWKEKLKEYINGFDVITISQNETKDNIYRAVVNSQETNRIILGSFVSLSKSWFTDTIIEKYEGKIMFIADEAHWLGADVLSKALLDKYAYRLGLTATPVRYFDIEGTEKLLGYFKGTIFKYTLKEAIRDGWLTPYDYHMRFAYLTDEETIEYQKLTRRYAKMMFASKNSQRDEDSLMTVISERAKIVKKAVNKNTVFRQLLQQLKNEKKLNYLLIYVEDNDQLSTYLGIMDEFDVEYRTIDGDTPGGDRDIILNDLAADKIDCVIAMKVLDEGVDIQNARRAIFISSSGNYKQFIQRRGRVLRIAENKKLAEIYDICVLVDTENQDDAAFKAVESKVTSSEFKRLAIFSISAHNKSECYNELERVGKKLNIDVFKIINDVREYA
jgi:superfamily II DNA or RNA helicase